MSDFRLAYDVCGSGTRPLLLLHGFTGTRASFAPVEKFLLPRFRLIRVDLPGHGASALPPSEGREGFVETLDALARILDEVEAPEVDVVGYSQGARVALGFALRFPKRVGRLVMESGSPGLHRRKDRIARRRDDEALAQQLLHSGVEAFVQKWELLPLFDGLRRLPPAAQEALRTRRASNSAEGLAGALRCLGTGAQPDYWPFLWRLRPPTLLLTGANDAKFTALARRMAADVPMMWSHAFEGVGHAPHLEVPDGWAREVVAFLETPWFDVPVVADQSSGATHDA